MVWNFIGIKYDSTVIVFDHTGGGSFRSRFSIYRQQEWAPSVDRRYRGGLLIRPRQAAISALRDNTEVKRIAGGQFVTDYYRNVTGRGDGVAVVAVVLIVTVRDGVVDDIALNGIVRGSPMNLDGRLTATRIRRRIGGGEREPRVCRKSGCDSSIRRSLSSEIRRPFFEVMNAKVTSFPKRLERDTTTKAE